jgi:hypothetical protein
MSFGNQPAGAVNLLEAALRSDGYGGRAPARPATEIHMALKR